MPWYRSRSPVCPPATLEEEYDSDEDWCEYGMEEFGEQSGPLKELSTVLSQGTPQLDQYSFDGEARWVPAISGLAIEGIGPIALPIVDAAQADAIARVSKPGSASPRGQPLEVDGSKVSFKNPKWADGIKQAETHVADQCGVSGVPLTARLNRLLLFRPGDSISKSAVQNGGPRDFATMVIQPPSEGTGGRLIVHGQGWAEPKTLRLGDRDGEAQFAYYYAVRPFDIEFEYTPVTQGYRLLVEYALLWPENGTPKPSLTLDADEQAHVVHALSRVEQEGRIFFHLFGHHYEEAAFDHAGSRMLHDFDQTIVATLRQASDAMDDIGFDFLITKVHYQRTNSATGRSFEGVEWATDDDDLEQPEVERIWTLDGQPLGWKGLYWQLGAQITKQTVLNPFAQSWVEAWSGHRTTSFDYDEDLLMRHRVYHKCLLVAFPKRFSVPELVDMTGPAGTFELLLTKDPAVAAPQVSEFLTLLPQLSNYPRPETIQFHQRILKALAAKRELHHLVGAFIDRLTSAELIGEGATDGFSFLSRLEAIPVEQSALFSLIGSDALWSDKALRAKVEGKFKNQLLHLVQVVNKCLDVRVPAWKWNNFLALLIETQTKATAVTTVGIDLGKVWRIAIEVVDPALCSKLVSQAMLAASTGRDAQAVTVAVEVLKTQKLGKPALFETKRQAITPLLSAYKGNAGDLRVPGPAPSTPAAPWETDALRFHLITTPPSAASSAPASASTSSGSAAASRSTEGQSNKRSSDNARDAAPAERSSKRVRK
ncbi:hypothetical protein OC835_006517 [Tilletia horrida]|nr:hypothetical protein OC835_006517 [Tilletia horrida]